KLWQIVPDPRYVADPKTGSRHNRGASVDLTLVDKSGNELTMPTPFDDFTEKAHRDYSQLPPEAIKNRKILQDAMEDEGFMGLPTEWWHFDDPEWSHFALRDEPLGSPSLRVEKTVKLSAGASTAAIGGEVKQLVVVRTSGWSEKGGTLQRFERSGEGWKRVGEPWPVSVGGKGLAWGRGLQPAEDGPMKQEGDLTAPAGIFPIGKSYGYADAAPAGSRWPYGRLGETSLCVDDPKSKHYNEIFDATPGVAKDWSSAETMRRKDHLYKWLLNVEQNTPVQCGCGSCIFLHIWRTPGATTEGCTAMEEENLLTLIRWLDPAGRAMLVQLPDEAYGKCRDAWGLP
ncbi:MAG: hypothetical protein JO102_04020, partial [Elusimicrobia bacterium]|nr:hypothetical protein [Elusimicrobiota bacterium]